MSWHFLRGQEEESWEGNSLDGAPDALLKLIPMHGESCLPDNETGSCHDSQYGTTSKPLTANRGAVQSTLSQGGFPARTLVAPERGLESKASDQDFGPKWQGLSMKFDPDTHLLKTHHCLWEEVLPLSSVTLPKWGMMRDGEFWERTTLPLRIKGTGSGLLPTPRSSDATRGDCPSERRRRSPNLESTVKQKTEARGQLNPTWVEWLMGWPIGWTDLRPLEMDRFHMWPHSHGKS